MSVVSVAEYSTSDLKKKRQYLRQRVTNFYNKYITDNNLLPPSKISSECDKLNSIKRQLDDLNEQIVLAVSDDEIEQKVLEDEIYENKIEEVLDRWNSFTPTGIRNQNRNIHEAASSSNAAITVPAAVHIPSYTNAPVPPTGMAPPLMPGPGTSHTNNYLKLPKVTLPRFSNHDPRVRNGPSLRQNFPQVTDIGPPWPSCLNIFLNIG